MWWIIDICIFIAGFIVSFIINNIKKRRKLKSDNELVNFIDKKIERVVKKFPHLINTQDKLRYLFYEIVWETTGNRKRNGKELVRLPNSHMLDVILHKLRSIEKALNIG